MTINDYLICLENNMTTYNNLQEYLNSTWHSLYWNNGNIIEK